MEDIRSNKVQISLQHCHDNSCKITYLCLFSHPIFPCTYVWLFSKFFLNALYALYLYSLFSYMLVPNLNIITHLYITISYSFTIFCVFASQKYTLNVISRTQRTYFFFQSPANPLCFQTPALSSVLRFWSRHQLFRLEILTVFLDLFIRTSNHWFNHRLFPYFQIHYSLITLSLVAT
jgi:hypothetical protein